ncbi:hypothetical protein J437_LFUL014163 [Ladona fulva]|uniref:Uncharacterized protein n=1 Tax=Ladona fulva TaxID=123851 RepID=A0A8K0KGU3_LADFU|nr:hypothetical protein J437_LFUL014163 [Ladona fulva]
MGLLDSFFVPLYEFHLTPRDFDEKFQNVILAFQLMQDVGLACPKSRPRAGVGVAEGSFGCLHDLCGNGLKVCGGEVGEDNFPEGPGPTIKVPFLTATETSSPKATGDEAGDLLLADMEISVEVSKVQEVDAGEEGECGDFSPASRDNDFRESPSVGLTFSGIDGYAVDGEGGDVGGGSLNILCNISEFS